MTRERAGKAALAVLVLTGLAFLFVSCGGVTPATSSVVETTGAAGSAGDLGTTPDSGAAGLAGDPVDAGADLGTSPGTAGAAGGAAGSGGAGGEAGGSAGAEGKAGQGGAAGAPALPSCSPCAMLDTCCVKKFTAQGCGPSDQYQHMCELAIDADTRAAALSTCQSYWQQFQCP